MISRATFVADTEVELVGSNGSPSFRVEIEFEASRTSRDREILAIRPYEWKRDIFGVMHTTRVFLDCPDWLTWLLKDAIDVDKLKVDWEDM